MVNIICYLNHYEPIYETHNTYKDGIYNILDIYEFFACQNLYFTTLSSDYVNDGYMDGAVFYKDGTYEHELFLMIDEGYRHIMSGEATTAEVDEYLSIFLKIVGGYPINDKIVLENINFVSRGHVLCKATDIYSVYAASQGMMFKDVMIPIKYIYKDKEGTDLGEEKFPPIIIYGINLDYPHSPELDFVYEEFNNLLMNYFDSWYDAVNNLDITNSNEMVKELVR